MQQLLQLLIAKDPSIRDTWVNRILLKLIIRKGLYNEKRNHR